MEISVWLAYSDDGCVMGAFRTRSGAIKCLKENALWMMDFGWTDEERARIVNYIEEDGGADGFGYVECVGELGE